MKLMKAREKLEFKITGVVVFALLLGMTIAVIVAVAFLRVDVFYTAKIYSEITASIIEGDLEVAMASADKFAQIRAVIERYKGVKGIESVEIIDVRKEIKEDAERDVLSTIKEKGKPTTLKNEELIIFYKPLLNTERCIGCHKDAGKFIGVIKVSTSLKGAYKRIAYRTRIILIGSIIGMLSIAILLSILLRKTVIKPIKEIEGATKMLSQGDLSFPVDIRSEDEMGRLSKDLKKAMRGIGGILLRIREISERASSATIGVEDESKKVLEGTHLETDAISNISTSIEEMNASIGEIAESVTGLSSSAEESATAVNEMVSTSEAISKNIIDMSGAIDTTSSSIEEMSSAIKEVAKSIEELSLSTEETLSASEEINASIREVESNIKEAARLSEKVTLEASGLGMESINKTIDGMEIIKDTVERTARSIKTLGGRSEEIGNILNVIDDITDQTTLLALNAAILAAQAGEHGKGFSVVADEIKALSERTASSTREIASLIQAVQSEVKGAVEAVTEGLRTAEDGSKLSKEAREALKKIVESSQRSSEMASSIEHSTTEQTKGVRLVRDEMERVKNMVDQIVRATSEQARGVGLIISEIEKIRDLSMHVKNATIEQSKGGRQIYEAVENVSEKIQEISRAINEQKSGSDQIVSAIDRIKDLPIENRRRSFSIIKSLRSLLNDTAILMTESEWFKVAINEVGVYKIGVIPLEAVTVVHTKFKPLADYLAKKIGEMVELRLAMDVKDTIRDIGEGRTSICCMSPTTYIEAYERYRVEVIAKALRHGRPYHHSIIIAKEGGRVGKIEDIKGKSFAFGDMLSTSSHIIPRMMLLDAGIDLNDLSFYTYLDHHDDVAMAVINGEFDAGGVMESVAERFKAQGLRFIKVSSEIPEFNVCVSKALPEAIKQSLKNALLELTDRTEEGASVLRTISPDYTGFTDASDRDYDGIREIMKRLKL